MSYQVDQAMDRLAAFIGREPITISGREMANTPHKENITRTIATMPDGIVFYWYENGKCWVRKDSYDGNL